MNSSLPTSSTRRRLTLLWLLAIAALGVIAATSGGADAQATIADVDQAEILWFERDSDTYQLEYSYITIDATADDVVGVENGAVVSFTANGDPGFSFTVDDVFAEIRSHQANGFGGSVAFDASTGVPQSFELWDDGYIYGGSFSLISYTPGTDTIDGSSADQLAREQDKLDAAEAIWAGASTGTYYLGYQYCAADTACTSDTNCAFVAGCGAQELFIVDDIVDIGQDIIGAGGAQWDFTVPELHAQIADALDSGAYEVRVSYNSQGVPTRIFLDATDGAGDETTYRQYGFSLQAPADLLAAEQAKLADAEAAWADRPDNHYYLHYQYCTADAACTSDTNCAFVAGCGQQELFVVNGVVDIGQDTIGAGGAQWDFTVPELHAQIAAALAAPSVTVSVTYTSHGVPIEILLDETPVPGDETTYTLRAFAFQAPPTTPNLLEATVTCLAGNGRIDVNIVNESATAAVYRLEIGTLPPRENTVQSKSWWRSPVTGRPDGPIDVVVKKDATVIYEETVTVACDADIAVSTPEVRFLTWCIGGNGIIAAQLANPTDQSRPYILEVDGIRRSTTAAAHGAAFRGVSGRPNGSYTAIVEIAGQPDVSQVIDVNC